MDDTTNVIENFEEILKQNAKKQPLALYRDQNSSIETRFQGQRLHSVKDVISKVAIQIKAIQKADVPNTSRQDKKKLDKYKRSSFVPVNMLPSDFEVPMKLPATKFETQCVSDTQLIHIIDNAEALADNNGITQEFDSTFSQTDIEKDACVDINYAMCIENNAIHENDSPTVSNADIELNNKNTSNSKMPRKANKNSNTETKIVTTEKVENHNFVTKSNENKAFVNCDKDITQIDTQLNNNCTEMLDKCIEIETNLNVPDFEKLDDDEIQPSLVFEAKKSKSPSPLVFDLETFEDFEKIAAPIIEENPDMKSAKQLINSQIIGKELFIQTDIPCEVSQINEQLSPVLQISAERLKITNTEHTNMDLKDHNYKDRNPIERNENDDTFLKDEILFSSDEENEYLHKEFQDIPLTCALETSFYEQPDMLDKTMYVGFQTASNRSIQISTESFSKAQSILDDLEKDVSSKATLTDLVVSLSVKHHMSNSLQSKMNPLATGIRFNTEDPTNVNFVEEEIDHLKRPDKRKFEGFKTVSRKKIKLSDMALARCKRVFQDIDLDDNYDTKIEPEINGSPPEENVKVAFYTGSQENEVKTGVDTRFESNQQIDDDILQEFANDMSLINDDNQNTESANFGVACNKDFQIPNADVLTTRKFFNTIDFSDSILEHENVTLTSEIANKKSFSQKNENMHKVFSLKTECNSSPEIIGFKTASNNQIKISSKALEKAKSLFQELNVCQEGEPNLNPGLDLDVEDFNQPATSKDFGGFKTASNKDIKISSEALVRSKSILQDIITYVCEDDLMNKPTNKEQARGFKTTDSKDIKMSKDQTDIDIHHAKDFDDDLNEVFSTELLDIEKEQISKPCGFKTASNKPVNISEKGLAHSKNLFKDLGVDDDLSSDYKKNMEAVPAMIMKTMTVVDMKKSVAGLSAQSKSFGNTSHSLSNTKIAALHNVPILGRTASKTPMNISDVPLVQSKEIFRDLDDRIDAVSLKDSFNETEEVPPFKGFQTANNKPITASNKALAKVKDIFKDIDDMIHESFQDFDVNKSTNIKPFGGFQTANNKAIKVSAKALAQSKALFKDIDNDSHFNINTSNKERIKPSYPTVNKTSVQIPAYDSDSKDLLEDIDKDTETSNLNNDKLNKFVGFQTASKKPVEISAQALAKSKAIFKDIDDEQHIIIKNDNTNVDNISTFKGFQIASNKTVKISTEALAKSKAIYQDMDKGFDAIENDNKNTNTDDIPKFAGFQTASKKPVNISAEALSKSKDLFKDIDKDLDAFEENNDKKPRSKEFKGFQTASKKPVQISDEELAKSKALFKDIEEAVIEENNTVTKKQNVPKFMGFQTASKKPVQVSDEALARSKALFKDIEEAVIEENDTVTKKQNVPKFMGFQTASKKPVQVSDEALARSKALFKDIEEAVIEENDTVTKKQNEPKFMGFQTASKKPVQVSDEALAKSKDLFKDIDEGDIVEQYGKTNKDDMLKFQGFQTASRKPVEISDEALARSQALFKDIDHEGIVEKYSSIGEPKFRGFETANKKPVQVSEEALAKSKALFKDFDGDIVFERNPTMSNKFLGLQTASNKSVKVSEEALARSKRIFDEIDAFQENNAINNKLSPFKGFETASKKKVKISEDALKKTRQIFQDIDIKYDDCKENLEDTVRDTKKLHFKSGNNKEIIVSENSLKDSRQLLTDLHTPRNNKEISKIDSRVFKEDNYIDKLIDTQVINNFEQTLHSEDFSKKTTPKKSKRSGSPILSCPRAKKRKFNTPYRNDGKTPTVDAKITPKHEDTLLFNKDYKKNKRYTLKNLAKVEETNKKLKPDPYILNFNMDNLLDFEFVGQRNDMTEDKFSIEDLKEYFLKVVNKKLVPIGWLDIHLKLILWKLISYEVKFTQTLNKVCTVKNVIEQLKFRYDKELYNVERPVLRKILEKDDAASKTMVLCVAGIFVDGVNVSSVTNISSNVELLLTDGWYCVKAVIDKMLTKLVYDEKITVGCKIVTNGAELMNCEQGVAPWEDTSSVRLKIYGNSTRRARWDARLGCHSNGAILTALSSVRPEGGKVSKLRLYVTRVYPMLYVEKFEDGSTVTRSERLENIHQIKYEADRQTTMEKLYEEVEKELSDQESQDSEVSQSKIRKHSGSMITESQTKCLVDKSNRQREKLLQNIEERVRNKIEEKGLNIGRNVVTLLKIRVAGVEDKESGVVVTKGFMSIWKPNDMLTEIIKEDSWIGVMNVVPTAIRYSEIHLSAGRQTVFNQSKFRENDKVKPYLKSMVRKCYPVGELSQNPTMTTDYNEIDTVGFIFQIDEESSKQPFQNMYLSDGERNIICVNFWGGLKKFGFQNVLDTGQIVSCTNLQKRAGNSRKSIPQFRVTEFTFFTKTPKNLVARNMIGEIEKKISALDKRKYCEECVKQKNNYSNKCLTENVSPYRFNDLNLTKNKMFIDSPLVAKREDNLSLTGLDFESSFRQTDTQELSPKSKERKRKVNEKIARLKMIGEPPPISPISIINKSKRAFNSYKSPLAQTSVASAEKSVEISKNDIQSSPIIPMNRTYVKNVNPVKLNFSNVQDNSLDEVDHFAEEFDGSPPLSLE